jgi:hypothetical protein
VGANQENLYDWIAHLDCSAQPGDDEELTQAARLAHPKGALLTGEDRLQAMLAAIYSVYFVHLEPRA